MFIEEDSARRILAHYGIESQLCVLAEECCELAQASLKTVRKGAETPYDNLIEELADVVFMIDQIMLHYGISEDRLESIIDWKARRQLARMEAEK